MGPSRLHGADEGRIAINFRRLRGRDLPGDVLPLTALSGVLGAAIATAVLALAVAAPLSAADIEAGRRKAQACAACHGADGNATKPGTPSLAGQPTMFTHWQLIKYRDGRRTDPEMSPAAEKLTDEDMADLAAFYAAQTPRARSGNVDPSKVEDGRQAAVYYHCTSCHRKDLSGYEQVPRLAGQDLDYVRKLLRAFKEKRATDIDGMMTMSAQPITEDDIEILAHFLASLGAEK